MLSKKFQECVGAVLHVALNTSDKPVSSKDICASHQMHPRHLEAMMQRLVRAGILRGSRGPMGGYALAKERRKITLAHLLEVTRECDKPTSCSVNSLSKKVILPVVQNAEQKLLEHLQDVTLDELCKSALAEEKDSSSTKAKRSDFVI